MTNMHLKLLSDAFQITGDFFDEKLCIMFCCWLFSMELDDGGIIEIAYLLETCFKDIFLDILIDFVEGLEFGQDQWTNHINVQLVVVLTQHISINCAEGYNK